MKVDITSKDGIVGGMRCNMLEQVKEIRERIRDDRVRYRDSVLRLTESHIVMNALWALEALEKENEELKARLDKAEGEN